MKGRKRTPLALVTLRGNPGRRPVNTEEPKPRVGRPKPPFQMSPEARKHFRTIVRELEVMGLLAACDAGRIAEAATALAKAEQCQAKIVKLGYWRPIIDESTGRLSGYERWPWTFEEPKAWEQFARAAACLGLDPTSRARLKANVTEKTVDPYQEFLEGSG